MFIFRNLVACNSNQLLAPMRFLLPGCLRPQGIVTCLYCMTRLVTSNNHLEAQVTGVLALLQVSSDKLHHANAPHAVCLAS